MSFDNKNRRPLGRPMYAHYKPVKPTSSKDWQEIIKFLNDPDNASVDKKICGGCGFAKLIDRNKVEYKIGRGVTIDYVKSLVNKIKKINNGDVRDKNTKPAID